MRLAPPLATVAAPLLAVVFASCGRSTTARSAAPDPTPGAGGASGDAVVASLDGDTIHRSDVDTRAGGVLAKLENETYLARRRALDEILDERLLALEAKSRSTTTEALLKAEVDDKTKAPTPAEVNAVYLKYASQLQGRTLADVQGDIRESLLGRAKEQRRAEFTRELRKKHGVRIALAAPRVTVPLPSDAPALGPDAAPITIVEYLDYQCPYCRRAQGTVDELLEHYKGRVRFVHRDFPIPGHPRAMAAAQAAHCAGEQGKFWDFHRGIFERPSDLSDQDLKTRAASLGLKSDAFATCLASGRHDASINSSTSSGTTLGVDSTPTFFVNGRRITGALPIPQFEEVIDEELARAGS